MGIANSRFAILRSQGTRFRILHSVTDALRLMPELESFVVIFTDVTKRFPFLTEYLRACGRNIALMRTRKPDDLIQFFMLQVLEKFSRMTSSLSVRDENFAWENNNRFIKVGVNHVKYLRNKEKV